MTIPHKEMVAECADTSCFFMCLLNLFPSDEYFNQTILANTTRTVAWGLKDG